MREGRSDTGSDAIRCARQHPAGGPWPEPLAWQNRARGVHLNAQKRTDPLCWSGPCGAATTMPSGSVCFIGDRVPLRGTTNTTAMHKAPTADPGTLLEVVYA